MQLRVCPYLNKGHNDEVHSSSLSVLSSAAVQGLRNWDCPFVSEFTQDVVLLIYLQYVIAYIVCHTQCLTCTVLCNMHEVMCMYMRDVCIIMHAIYATCTFITQPQSSTTYTGCALISAEFIFADLQVSRFSRF